MSIRQWLKDFHANWAQHHLDQRWCSEFAEIYALRVKQGLTRNQADVVFDETLTTRLSDLALAVRGLYDRQQRDVERAGMHDSIDYIVAYRTRRGGQP